MTDSYSKWSDVRAGGRAAYPRTDDEQAVGKAAARERREAYARGHRLAEMRTTAGVTQAERAGVLGVWPALTASMADGSRRPRCDEPVVMASWWEPKWEPPRTVTRPRQATLGGRSPR